MKCQCKIESQDLRDDYSTKAAIKWFAQSFSIFPSIDLRTGYDSIKKEESIKCDNDRSRNTGKTYSLD